jgi:hypothetical protein
MDWRDRAAHQLGRKWDGWEKSKMQRGTGSLEKHHDNRQGRRNKGQPSPATSVRAGYLDQKMRDRNNTDVNGVSGPKP